MDKRRLDFFILRYGFGGFEPEEPKWDSGKAMELRFMPISLAFSLELCASYAKLYYEYYLPHLMGDTSYCKLESLSYLRYLQLMALEVMNFCIDGCFIGELRTVFIWCFFVAKWRK